MGTKINTENIFASIEFNFEEVKSGYVKNRKIKLEKIFIILKSKNENAFYDKNKKKITIIYEIGESSMKFFIYGTGKILCMGARSEEDLYCALEKHFQKVCKIIGIKKMSASIKNIMATAVFDYKINLEKLENYKKDDCEITYNPEFFHGATYKSKLGTGNIFANGKIVVITKRKDDVLPIVNHIEKIISINNAAIPS